MPLLQTSGNITADGYGGGAAAVPNYIEDVFSTYLYKGNGSSSQTITNGIDLSTKGGLVWTKARTQTVALNNGLTDTVRGNQNVLFSDSTSAQYNVGATVTNQTISSFNTNGFTLGGDQILGVGNYNSSCTYASWTFRKQPKFFDIVTYTGTGANRTISHNLGSAPGCIIVKRTDTTSNWQVYHRNLTSAAYSIQLNLTNAEASATTVWNSTAPTSTVFSVGTDATVNASGGTYVAYIYAHDAGGFGLTGTDNVISCGAYTGTGGSLSVTLGYEPQWVLIKRTDASGAGSNWQIVDNMRGWVTSGVANRLFPNLSDAESQTGAGFLFPTATGFGSTNASFDANTASATYIYIAIRKGPMKVPTDATKVFNPYTATNAQPITWTNGFPADFSLTTQRTTTDPRLAFSRLIGNYPYTATNSTAAETNQSPYGISFDAPTNTLSSNIWSGTNSALWYSFRRAPNFFDQVCFTSTGLTNQRVNHNLGVAPELIFTKVRSKAGSWWTYASSVGRGKYLSLNTTADPQIQANCWGTTDPTSTDFGIDSSFFIGSGTDVAYLFATCAGVSKVGSYTGTGTLTTINCGFTGGARFVLIKRTDTTGNWFVWDTARGMVAGTDPSITLNATGAETNANSVYTATTGFQLLASPSADVNTNGGTYIYLAIA